MENYVFFDEKTALGDGDLIRLYDGKDRLIGVYSGNMLSGKKITVKNRYLKIVLESNDDESQGWGFGVKNVEHLSYGALLPLYNSNFRGGK